MVPAFLALYPGMDINTAKGSSLFAILFVTAYQSWEARRAGIKRVILPRGNQKDLRDLPEEVRSEMEFIFAERVEDVLRAVLPDLIQEPAKAA